MAQVDANRARSLPLGATLLTLIMVAVLIWLGLWQLQRRDWKHNIQAELTAAASLPPVTPRDFLDAMAGSKSLQFRRATIDCRPGRVATYDIKGGTSSTGNGGYRVLVACRDPLKHYTRGPDIVVVAGWTTRPDAVKTLDLDTSFTGTLIEHPYDKEPGRPQFLLIPTSAVAPLLPSRIPTPGELPDNHLSYALQWFAFAITLAVIYAIYVRRWRRERLGVLPAS